jgi:hypothetical protein
MTTAGGRVAGELQPSRSRIARTRIWSALRVIVRTFKPSSASIPCKNGSASPSGAVAKKSTISAHISHQSPDPLACFYAALAALMLGRARIVNQDVNLRVNLIFFAVIGARARSPSPAGPRVPGRTQAIKSSRVSWDRSRSSRVDRDVCNGVLHRAPHTRERASCVVLVSRIETAPC